MSPAVVLVMKGPGNMDMTPQGSFVPSILHIDVSTRDLPMLQCIGAILPLPTINLIQKDVRCLIRYSITVYESVATFAAVTRLGSVFEAKTSLCAPSTDFLDSE